MRLRILHIIVGLGVGGAERSLLRLVGAHATDSRYEHLVVSLTGEAGLRRDFIQAGATVFDLDFSRPSRAPLVFLQLIRLIRTLQPDVVHCWMYHADLLGGLAAKLCGVRTVLWGVRNSHLEGNSKAKRAIRAACSMLSGVVPTKVVCVGEQAKCVHQAVGYESKKMVVIPNGYDTEDFRPDMNARDRIRQEFGFGVTDIVVGSIGRFSPAKDHPTLVRAAAEALRHEPRLKFLMIGRGVDEDGVLSSMISSLGLAGSLFAVGQRDDIADCLNGMDIFCLHSRTEGFPNALAEAMSVARPCIATDVGDCAVMLDGIGAVVKPSDPVALARAILEVASFPVDEREERGLRLRRRIQERYSLASTVHQYEALYEGHCSHRRKS